MKYRYAPFCFFGLAVFVVYYNVYENQFLLDDEFLIQKNIFIKSWDYIFELFSRSSTGGAGGIDSFYRPMQTICYLIVNQFLGYSTYSFHFLNVTLHFLNCCLFFILGQRLGFNRNALVLAITLWGVHPIHTEAVTYMSATADPLHTLFGLLALTVVVPTFSLKRMLLSAPLFCFCLLSKEAGIVLPALACVCLYFSRKADFRWRELGVTWPWWTIAFTYLVLRKTVLNFDNTFTFFKNANIYTENISFRIFTFLATIPNYIKLLIVPYNLHLERNFSVYTEWTFEVILGFIILISLISVFYWERNSKNKIWSFSVLWLMVVHAPHTGILIPVNAFFLEHWMYFVSLGFVLLMVHYLQKNFERGKWFFFVLIPVYGLITIAQNRKWSDPITFYEYVISVEKKPITRLFTNLGMAYSDRGNLERAKEFYERAIADSDSYPQTRHNLGYLYFQMGQIDVARINFLKALELDPEFYHSLIFLSEISRIKGDLEQQKIYLDKYRKIKSRFE